MARGVDGRLRPLELFAFGQVVEKFPNGRDFSGARRRGLDRFIRAFIMTKSLPK
jgi:hypothetical protein